MSCDCKQGASKTAISTVNQAMMTPALSQARSAILTFNETVKVNNPLGAVPYEGALQPLSYTDTCQAWATLGSRDDRIAFVLQQLIAGGIPTNVALGLVAVSGMEVAFNWLIKRDPVAMPITNISCRCTIPVGFEPGGSGNVPASAWNNPQIKAYLLGQHPKNSTVLVDVGPSAAKWNSKLTGAIFSLDILRFWEVTCAERWTETLQNFSLGPTQMHMVGTGLTPATPNAYPGWGTTWEWVWDGYIPNSAPSPIVVAGLRSAAYLQNKGDWPTTDGNEAPERAWAATQNGGNGSLGTSYYEGINTFANSNGGLRTKAQIVRGVAKAKGILLANQKGGALLAPPI